MKLFRSRLLPVLLLVPMMTVLGGCGNGNAGGSGGDETPTTEPATVERPPGAPRVLTAEQVSALSLAKAEQQVGRVHVAMADANKAGNTAEFELMRDQWKLLAQHIGELKAEAGIVDP